LDGAILAFSNAPERKHSRLATEPLLAATMPSQKLKDEMLGLSHIAETAVVGSVGI
jgi:hypothetical protein